MLLHTTAHTNYLSKTQCHLFWKMRKHKYKHTHSPMSGTYIWSNTHHRTKCVSYQLCGGLEDTHTHIHTHTDTQKLVFFKPNYKILKSLCKMVGGWQTVLFKSRFWKNKAFKRADASASCLSLSLERHKLCSNQGHTHTHTHAHKASEPSHPSTPH